MRPVSRPIAAAVLACLAAGCGKPLEDGTYAFEVRSITQDSCSATPVDELLLPDARVETAGETVQISFSAAGPLVPGLTGASGSRALVGRYLPDDERDRFIADATFDVVREIGGLSCIVFSHASIAATVRDATSFDGALRLSYTRRAEAQAACAAGCVVELVFEARRVGG